MERLLFPTFEREQLLALSNQALAHVGDAVFDLMVRVYLCSRGAATSRSLHKRAVARVSAGAQAESAQHILPLLDEEERGVYMRGRNANTTRVPQGADRRQYAMSTGFEALFGYLYLAGRHQRIQELFDHLAARWHDG